MNMFDVHKQFLAYFPLEMGVLHFEIVLLFVCVLPSFQLLNKLLQTWYEHYAIGGDPNTTLFDLLQSITARL
jgi:hypothetical protein